MPIPLDTGWRYCTYIVVTSAGVFVRSLSPPYLLSCIVSVWTPVCLILFDKASETEQLSLVPREMADATLANSDEWEGEMLWRRVEVYGWLREKEGDRNEKPYTRMGRSTIPGVASLSLTQSAPNTLGLAYSRGWLRYRFLSLGQPPSHIALARSTHLRNSDAHFSCGANSSDSKRQLVFAWR